MFKIFIENDIISSNQFGFTPGDSWVFQLVSITHEFYKSFDKVHEGRGVFLDISIAFDKVWHKGNSEYLTQKGISGNLFKLLRDFLNERRQSIVLNLHMDKCHCWNSSRFSSWSIIVFNLYEQFHWRTFC